MIEYKNIKWFMHHGVLMPCSPPHINIELSDEDQKHLIKETNARFVRWTNQFDKNSSNFWYIIKDSFAGFKELSRNTRSKVRRGEKNFYVKPVEFQTIREEGYSTYLNAFYSYNTFERPMTKAQFCEHINQLENSAQYELWGCWDKQSNTLVGFSENWIFDKTCFYEYIYFDPNFLMNYLSYILFYVMNQHYLLEKGFKYVYDGSRNLSHETNVQEFLVNKFGFRKAFCNLCIAYRKDISLLVSSLYPFRYFIYQGNDQIRNKLAVLLRHEEIRRSM